MNKFLKGSFVVLCAFFSISYGSQVPVKQCISALLTIEGFGSWDFYMFRYYLDVYKDFEIPCEDEDEEGLCVAIKSVRVQEYAGLSITDWLESTPQISPLSNGLEEGIYLSDRRFPRCVPAGWLFDSHGTLKENITVQCADGGIKVNFTVFMPTSIVRELVSSDNSVFTLMEKRREQEESQSPVKKSLGEKAIERLFSMKSRPLSSIDYLGYK